ncbi:MULTISPECIES: hypothetical protein [Acidithiobacillus]|jgi:hypothetical protein|uniref:hypothetical protein n=1 Tax=Acidithiobacillus TaxID=119977 RepID=UPI000ACFADD0|nr:hypothetical protein [Acidithiobacillus ferrooxidans]
MMGLDALAERMLHKRLAESSYDWTSDADTPEARWLRWATVMNATRMLRSFPFPAIANLRRACRNGGPERGVPEVDLSEGERLLMRFAMAYAMHQLIRIPDMGPVWNAIQAQRRDAKILAARLEQQGRHAEAVQVMNSAPQQPLREEDRKPAVPTPRHPTAAIVQSAPPSAPEQTTAPLVAPAQPSAPRTSAP